MKIERSYNPHSAYWTYKALWEQDGEIWCQAFQSPHDLHDTQVMNEIQRLPSPQKIQRNVQLMKQEVPDATQEIHQ